MRMLIPVVMTILFTLAGCRHDGAAFRHDTHRAAAKGSCAPCHGDDPASPGKATAASCAPCHKEAEGQAARYAGAIVPAPRPHGYADVAFSHEPHAGAGISCATCHGSGKRMVLPAMAECTACHAREGAARDCSTCHRILRKDVRPQSHGADWEALHGEVSRSMNATCALCHEERTCSACHATKKPRSHVGGWDKSAHGPRAVEDRESCVQCHEAGFCNRCHAAPPPSHFIGNFRFGGHKAQAQYNPRSCAVCHERSFCRTCHPGA